MEYLVKFLCLLLMCGSVVFGQDTRPESPQDFPTTRKPTTVAIPTITTTTESPTTVSTTTTTTTKLPSTTTTTTTKLPATTTRTTTTKLPPVLITTTTELPRTTTKKSTTPNRPTPSINTSSPYYPGYTNPWTPCYQKQYVISQHRRLRYGGYTYRTILTCYRCCYQGPNGCYKLYDGPCRGPSFYSFSL